MPITDLLIEGLYLMLLGMGIVFTFLTLLVGAMKLMSQIAQHLAVEPLVETPAVVPQSHPQLDQSQELVAVISAAISRYRKN